MNFLHRHHVTWTWQRYHQHLRQGVCIIYIKYIPWKKYHRKKCQLNNRQKNNKFNMIGWHNDWYAPQSTQDFSMHGFLIPNLYEMKSKIIEQRHTLSDRRKKHTELIQKLSEIYNEGIWGEKFIREIHTNETRNTWIQNIRLGLKKKSARLSIKINNLQYP